jgi:hypothetical protein
MGPVGRVSAIETPSNSAIVRIPVIVITQSGMVITES